MYTAYTYLCLLMHLCCHLHFAKVLAREERDEQAQCAARDLLHGYALHCWISIYCMKHPAGLCACAVTINEGQDSPFDSTIDDL